MKKSHITMDTHRVIFLVVGVTCSKTD